MFNHYLQQIRMFNRDVRLYLVTAAVTGFSVFGGVYTVLLNLYLLRLGYGPEFIGLVNGSGLLAFGAFSLPAGALGGRWGSRRIMIVGMAICAAGHGLLPMSELMPISLRAGWLLMTYTLGYLGFTTYIVNSSPFLMSTTTFGERNVVFSVQTALWGLAGFAGSLVGGLMPGFFATNIGISLSDPAPYRYSLLIAAVLIIPAVLALLATRKTGTEGVQHTIIKAGKPPFGLIILISFVGLLGVTGEGAARVFFNVYLDAGLSVSTERIGVLSATGQLLAVPAALAMPLLAARLGKERTIALSYLGRAVSLLPMAFIPHWGAAGFSFIAVIALASVARPAFTVYHQEIVTPGWRAAMSGATTMAAGLGFSAMALGGGYLIAALGYRSLFLIGTSLSAAGAVLYWAYFRVPRGELGRASSSHTEE